MLKIRGWIGMSVIDKVLEYVIGKLAKHTANQTGGGKTVLIAQV